MSNTLQSVHPELVSEWSDKNLPLTPDKITFGSNKRVWWKGSCGHEWQASVKARSGGEKCPICSGARVVEGINDLATLKPQLAQEWSKKNELKPTEVSVASHKKVIWKCKNGHEWTASIKSRTVNGTGCPYCSHNKVLAGFNDLASQYPEVAAEWSDRNLPLQPTMVTAFANSKAWYGFDSRVEWCACFVSWCADQCGYIDSGLIPKFAGCIDGANWFKSNNRWNDQNYEPKAGDIIFFDWEDDGTTDHVGIVEKCENGTVYTVEGNSGDACRQRQYTVGSRNIYGYGIPAY